MFLSICCITYNHGDFVSEAINSFLRQNTNFDFEIIISDDCSTDLTQKICREFKVNNPKKIKLYINDSNVGMVKNFTQALQLCQGKYIAVCEGDDYWTDPDKLQKQVNFLEANSSYSICWSKYQILNGTKFSQPEWIHLMENKDRLEITLDNFYNPYSTQTLTALFKREVLQFSLLAMTKYTRDNTIYCMCLSKGNGAVLNFFSGVYRCQGNGSFSTLSIFNQCYSSFLSIKEIIQAIPNCDNQNLRKVRNKLLLVSFEVSVFNRTVGFYKNLNLYFKVLRYCSVAEKMKSTKIMLKQLNGMRKGYKGKLPEVV